MKTKNIIIYLLVTLLTALTIYLLLTSNKNTSTYRQNKFSVKNTEQITQIKIIENKQIVTLTKNDNYWTANNNKASNDKINQLLYTINNLKISKPVNKNQKKEMANKLKKGLLIEIYKKNKLKKDFFIKTDTNKKVYIMSKNKQIPFELSLLEWNTNPINYLTTDETYWQSKKLINCVHNLITSIKLTHTDNSKNFLLEKKQQLFYINNKTITPQIAYAFLKKITEVNFLKYINEINPIKKDSIINSKPIFTIEIKTNESTQQIKGFKKRLKSNNDFFGDKTITDPDTLHILTNKNHLVYAKYYDLFTITNAVKIYFE